MTDPCDSRALRYGNSFGQVLSEPGAIHYAVVPAFGRHFALDMPFIVNVADGPEAAANGQLHVSVGFHDGHYAVSPPVVNARRGDIIQWSCDADTVPPFAVFSEKGELSSDRLCRQSVFTHIVKFAETIEWVDSHGSGITGTLEVTAPSSTDDDALRKWRRQLSQGVVVTISGKKKHYEAHAFIGQHIFFAVEDAPGISITRKAPVPDDLEEPSPPPPATAPVKPAKDKARK